MTTPVNPTPVEDDPTKPWKAIAAFVAPGVLAFLVAILNAGPNKFPDWLWILITGLIAAVSAYVVKNPKRLKKHPRNQAGETTSLLGIVIAVLAIVVLIVVLARVL